MLCDSAVNITANTLTAERRRARGANAETEIQRTANRVADAKSAPRKEPKFHFAPGAHCVQDARAPSGGVCATSKGYAKLSPMSNRPLLSIILVAVVLSATSCAGSLFKVKPVVELPPLAGDVKSASAGGVSVRLAPLMSDEESQDIFEANLPLSGILPVRVELAFESGVPVETKKVRFRLRDG